MDKLEQKVISTIREYHMLEPGGRVIAALSGGADSVCLLALLLRLGGKLGIELRAVHVHHGLRGAEADRDAEFAETLCAEYSVPCHIIRVDVRRTAAERGMSEEEAARLLRYEALEREASAWETEDARAGDSAMKAGDSAAKSRSGSIPGSGRPGAVRIAVAHHSGDQAETILHNLFRGSGLSGLKGIPYVRGRIIRPLLDADRGEILAWLKEHGLSFVQDSTNTSGDYTRNRIRTAILPAIESQVNAGAAGNILRTGRMAAMADSYLKEQCCRWIEDYVEMQGGFGGGAGAPPESVFLPVEALLKQPEILRYYAVMELMKRLAGSAKDLGWIHGEQVLALAGKTVGKQADLPYGLYAERGYEGIRIGRQESRKEPVPEALPTVEMRQFPYKKGVQFPKNMYTKWFDCDKIKGTPMVRTRRQGDYICLLYTSRCV